MLEWDEGFVKSGAERCWRFWCRIYPIFQKSLPARSRATIFRFQTDYIHWLNGGTSLHSGAYSRGCTPFWIRSLPKKMRNGLKQLGLHAWCWEFSELFGNGNIVAWIENVHPHCPRKKKLDRSPHLDPCLRRTELNEKLREDFIRLNSTLKLGSFWVPITSGFEFLAKSGEIKYFLVHEIITAG